MLLFIIERCIKFVDAFKQNSNWERGLLQVVDNAFKAIMLSGQGKFADILLSEVNQLEGIDRVQVYDKEGMYVAFGNDDREVDEEIIENILDEFHSSNDYWSPRNIDKFHFSPLPNMFPRINRCHRCY